MPLVSCGALLLHLISDAFLLPTTLQHISVLDINRSNTTRIPVSFRSWPKLVSLSLVNGMTCNYLVRTKHDSTLKIILLCTGKIEELPECIGACGPTLELLNVSFTCVDFWLWTPL